MEIYVTQRGDTIQSIAEKYNISVAKLMQDNGLIDSNDLIIGQTIVIAHPKQTYIVKEGDTLNSIAEINNITLMQLLRNNPFLSDREYIYPGEELTISYDTKGTLTTNGFIFPFINKKTLGKILPNLTYLSVFNYMVMEKGEINSYYDDTEILQLSKDFGTVPLMVLTTLSLQGELNIDVAYKIATNEEYQDQLIGNTLTILKEKGYRGVNMIFNYITTSNQAVYKQLIRRIASKITQEGYLYFATINSALENTQANASFEQIDYTGLSETVNGGIIFLKFVWGTNYGSPAPVSNTTKIKSLIDYALTSIPANKLIMGEPLISYDWKLPYIPGKSSANSLTLDSALNIAKNTEAILQFDKPSQTTFFTYAQSKVRAIFQHIVWTLDARSIDSLVAMVNEYLLNGICFWNVMIFYSQLWLVINSQYEIEKLL